MTVQVRTVGGTPNQASSGTLFGTSASVTLPLTPVEGNAYIVVMNAVTNNVANVAGPAGSSVAREQSRGSSNPTVAIYYGVFGASPSATITCSVTTSMTKHIFAAEMLGLDTSAMLLSAVSGYLSSTTTITTPTLATTGAAYLVAAVAADGTFDTTEKTASASFTEIDNQFRLFTVVREVAGAGSYSTILDWTGTTDPGSARGASCALVSFKINPNATVPLATPIAGTVTMGTVTIVATVIVRPAQIVAATTMGAVTVTTSVGSTVVLLADPIRGNVAVGGAATAFTPLRPETIQCVTLMGRVTVDTTRTTAVFVPPVVFDAPSRRITGDPGMDNFSRYFGPLARGVNVFYKTDGTFTETQPPDDQIAKIYHGAHIIPITSEEAARLIAAGYDVSVVAVGAGGDNPSSVDVGPSIISCHTTMGQVTVTTTEPAVVDLNLGQPIMATTTMGFTEAQGSPNIIVQPQNLIRATTSMPAALVTVGSAAELLPYNPNTVAPLASPYIVYINNATRTANIPAGRDFIVSLPGAQAIPSMGVVANPQQTALQVRQGFQLIGSGRNGWIIGGAIRHDVDYVASGAQTFPSNGLAATDGLRAMYLNNGWTGALYIEGVEIGGTHLYEGINMDNRSTTAKLYMQNIRYADPVHVVVYTDGAHDGGDIFQNWGGPQGGLHLVKFTARSHYQGFFMQSEAFFNEPSITEFSRVDISGPLTARAYPAWTAPGKTKSGTNMPMGRYLYWQNTPQPTTMDRFNLKNGERTFGQSVHPDDNDANAAVITTIGGVQRASWPANQQITGYIEYDASAGDINVKAGQVGVGYTYDTARYAA